MDLVSSDSITHPGNLSSSDHHEVLSLDIIRQLPKAELHLHLDGSVRPSTILELATEQCIELPTTDLQELRRLICVSSECPSLVEYLRGFAITNSVLQKAYALTRVMYELCEDCVADGITYAEIRFSPILHTLEELNLSAVMEAVIEGLALAQLRLSITVGIIVCGLRDKDPSVTAALAEIAWRYKHRGIVGFDLAGPEDGFSSKVHKAAFDIARSKCLNVTLHSGENAGWDSIHDSLRYCGAQRIGHGTHIIESPDLLKYTVDRQIALECCLTSNEQTKAVPKVALHPLRQLIESGVLCTLCTDNRTVSNVTLSGEYHLAQRTFGLSVAEIVMLLDNGFRSSFIQHGTRTRIRIEAVQRTLEILRDHNIPIDSLYKHPYGPFLNHTVRLEKRQFYWSNHINPPMSLEIVRRLPKADLHCRLHGSVSLAAMHREIMLLSPAERHSLGLEPYVNEDSLLTLAIKGPEDALSEVFKRIQYDLLQTREQIQRGLDDVFQVAQEDHVTYIELMVRPNAHCNRGLSEQEVVASIIDYKRKLEQQPGANTKINIIIYSDLTERDPLRFQRDAELTLEVMKLYPDVVGFAVFGTELELFEYKYFESTFKFLKDNQIKVVINSGRTVSTSIIEALHMGGASRISGAFTLHKTPELMDYLANNSIPVEIGETALLRDRTAEIRSFVDPIRLYFDNNVTLVLCSFRQDPALGPTPHFYRSDRVMMTAQRAQLNMAELLRIVGNSYLYNFASYEQRLQMFNTFWEEASGIVTRAGWDFLKKIAWMPRV